jgi:hypothetical protein
MGLRRALVCIQNLARIFRAWLDARSTSTVHSSLVSQKAKEIHVNVPYTVG